MNQTRIDMVGVTLRVANMDVVHFPKLTDRTSKTADAVATTILNVELLDDLLERAHNLHVTELSIAVQVFILI